MSKSLVIVESPTKVKSVSKYLGIEYKVVASVGHIRSLKDVEIDREFNPIYKQSEDEIERIEGIREGKFRKGIRKMEYKVFKEYIFTSKKHDHKNQEQVQISKNI